MKSHAIVGAVAVSALVPSATIGCGVQNSTQQASPSTETYSVAITASTVGDLGGCTSALSGTVAHVDSPPSLWRCASGKWTQIACSTSEGGDVAYASTPPTLWACVGKRWTQIAWPDAGPPGSAGPAGKESLIQVTNEPPGSHCADGGVRIDVGIDTDGDGTLQATEIQHTAYVCNGVGSSGASDAGGDAPDAPNIPDGLLDYPANHVRAFCTAMSACCPAYGAGAFDIAACEGSYLSQGWDTTLPGATSIYDAGHLTFDANQAQLCISALQGLTCAAQLTAAEWSAITTSCQNVLGGTIPIGSTGCQSSFECVSGSYCSTTVDAGSSCKPLVGDGGTCTADEMCSYAGTGQPAMFCNLFASDGGAATSGVCQPAQANGATCANPGVIDDFACTSLLCGDTNNCGDPATNPSAIACPAFVVQDAGGGD